ncbi:MAG: CIA30 family protein [Armatimonadota bacterium]|jgi:hypothetical protein
MRLHARCALGVFLAAVTTGMMAVAAQGGQPNAQESAALAALKGRLTGMIVWESNRTGVWELYVMNADGTGARRLTSLATPGDPLAWSAYLRPRFSPDGRQILFGYGKAKAPAECWVADSQTGEARRLTIGNPLNWLPDGSGFLLLRGKQVMLFDLASGEAVRAVDAEIANATDNGSMVGHVTPSLSAGVFRFAKNEYIRLSDGKVLKTTGGCEPRLTDDGRFMYWVQGPKDFRVWDTQKDEERQMLGVPAAEPHNYTYFPTVSADRRWLMYAASPGQHDHSTSDYEIYLQQLDNWQPSGAPVRLTFNSATDRWPDLWLGPRSAGDGGYDVASNRRMNPAPSPLRIFSFSSDGAAPDWGGQSGLWPQVEGCMGEATWVSEDAEDGNGGSMRITYDIRAEPRSFSMWFAPGRHVDLSAYDHFVLYARGDVPTFTLVVKDSAADPAGASDAGVADLLVRGVSGSWQRFELRFADFVPRVTGSSIDWSNIDHIGVALIADRNASAGTLQVDNMRATATD